MAIKGHPHRRPAVFFDKDGTLIYNVPYNVETTLMVLYPDAAYNLRRLRSEGFSLVVVSNQSGVARGLFSTAEVDGAFEYLQDMLWSAGAPLDGYFYCPHHPQGAVADYRVACYCRKPLPGLLYAAAKKHRISLENSWMVGDILHDIEAGNRAGCRTILLDNGHETEWNVGPYRLPDFTAGNLTRAVDIILEHDYERRWT